MYSSYLAKAVAGFILKRFRNHIINQHTVTKKTAGNDY